MYHLLHRPANDTWDDVFIGRKNYYSLLRTVYTTCTICYTLVERLLFRRLSPVFNPFNDLT